MGISILHFNFSEGTIMQINKNKKYKKKLFFFNLKYNFIKNDLFEKNSTIKSRKER